MSAESITRWVVATALLAGVGPAAAAVSWRSTPEYLELFAPVNHRQAYRADVSAADLDQVLADLRADPALGATPGAWEAHSESAQDAFGTAGPYNRWRLALTYGSRTPRVARGARLDRGRVVEVWTLVSPYPSADLRTLHPGTLRLILGVAP